MIAKLVKNKVARMGALVLLGIVLGGAISNAQFQSEIAGAERKVADAEREVGDYKRLAGQVQDERNDLLGALNDVCTDFQNSMFGLSAMLGDAKGPLWESWHNTGVEHCSYQGFPLE